MVLVVWSVDRFGNRRRWDMLLNDQRQVYEAIFVIKCDLGNMKIAVIDTFIVG